MIDSCFIVTYLSSIFCWYVLTYSYSFFSETKINISQHERSIILIFSLFTTTNNLYNIASLKIPVSIFILFIFFHFLYKESFYKCLFLTNFICLLSLFTEFLISITTFLIVNNLDLVNNSLLMKTSFSLISFWSYYFVYQIPFFKYLYKKLIKIFENKKEIIAFIYCFLFMVGSMYVIYSLDFKNIKVYILSIVIIFVFAIVMYLYFRELNNNQILNIKNKYLTENQLLFKNTLNDFRILRHNLLNDFLFISSLCTSDIQNIINEKITKYNIDMKNFNDITSIPEGLQGILYFKSSVARKQNIEFYIDGNSDIQNQILNKRLYIDLYEVVGIILDNAIEAASKSAFKTIYFNFYNDNNNLKIEVLNTYKNDIDLNNIGNKNYSTKKIKSGLGLYYIQKLNSNIEVKKSIINDLFKIKINVKIK